MSDRNAVTEKNEIIDLAYRNNIVPVGFFIKDGNISIRTKDFEGNFRFYARVNSSGDFMMVGKGPFDIELLRVYGIKDSIFIIDRMNKVNYTGLQSSVMKKYGVPGSLWSYVIGDVPMLAADVQNVKDSSGYIELTEIKRDLGIRTLISRETGKPYATYVTGYEKGASVNFRYENILNYENFFFPSKINVDSDQYMFHVEINIDNIRISFNEDIYPRVPDYKTVAL